MQFLSSVSYSLENIHGWKWYLLIDFVGLKRVKLGTRLMANCLDPALSLTN